MRIAHLTSVHGRHDIRIFKKECLELASAGYDTILVVCDGKGDELIHDVRIIDAGYPGRGRLRRILIAPRLMKRIVKDRGLEIVHLHDPELLILVPWLREIGVRTIFDAHENWPMQIYGKTYLPPWSKSIISKIAATYEAFYLRKVDHVITVTQKNVIRLSRINRQTSLLRNYPRIELFNRVPALEKIPRACYAGDISKERGAIEMAKAAALIRGKFYFAGNTLSDILSNEIEAISCGKVVQLGYIKQEELFRFISLSSIGVILSHPSANNMDSSPNKLFEYMAAGLAIVASDFPLWRKIIDESRCGICVDPFDYIAVAKIINRLIENPEEATEMGENGRRAVEKNYSWHSESTKLLAVYNGFRKSVIRR